MGTRKDNIRVTILAPGAVGSELKEGSSDAVASQNVKGFYKIAIPADSIARAIAHAIEQPSDVEIDELPVRPLSRSSKSLSKICRRYGAESTVHVKVNPNVEL